MSRHKYTIKFEKQHKDIISGISQFSTSAYQQHNITQESLPRVITEITEKGYDIIRIHRSGYDEE